MKRIPWLLYSLAIVVAAGVLWAFPKWTVDDAFISYRYGVNLVETGQLVWNPGERPVEGYTGIMLPLIAAAAHYIGIDIILTVKLIMLISWLGVIGLLYFAGKELKINQLVVSASILLWVLNPILYTHLFSGLETILFAFLMLALLVSNYLIIRQENSGTWASLLASMVGVLLILTRPEGMALVPILMGGTLVAKWMIWKKWDFKYLVILLIFCAIPVSIYIFWRLSYYGSWLPNTWYAKKYDGAFNSEAILEMGHTIMVTIGPMLVWVVLGRIVFKPMGGRLPEDLSRSWLFLFSCLVPIVLALGYSQSHLFMNYSHRFFAPAIAVLLLPMMLEGDRILKNLQVDDAKRLKKNLLLIGITILSVTQCIFFIIKLKTEITWSQYYERIVEQEFEPVAKRLKEELSPDAKVAIYMDAGVIPFRTRMQCIDFGKLNDSTLAHGPRDPGFVADYFFGQAPDAAVFTSFAEEKYDYIDEAEFIMADPRFENYRLLEKFKTDHNDPYYQFLFVRTTSNATYPE